MTVVTYNELPDGPNPTDCFPIVAKCPYCDRRIDRIAVRETWKYYTTNGSDSMERVLAFREGYASPCGCALAYGRHYLCEKDLRGAKWSGIICQGGSDDE